MASTSHHFIVNMQMETLCEEQKNTNMLPDQAPNGLFRHSDELPQNNTVIEIDDNTFDEESIKCKDDLWLHMHSKTENPARRRLVPRKVKMTIILELMAPRKKEEARRKKVNNKSLLPVSNKDLIDSTLSLKAFLCLVLLSVIQIPHQAHFALLIMCCSFLSYQAKNLTYPFDLQFGNSTNSPHSLVSLDEAFTKFFPEITHITKFMLCYLMTLMLVWPLQLGVQIFIVLLLISTPLYYFPQLVTKAPVVDVACGSFELSLIWFTILGALGLCLICISLTLFLIYLSWRYMHEGRPIVKELKVGVDDFWEILVG